MKTRRDVFSLPCLTISEQCEHRKGFPEAMTKGKVSVDRNEKSL
jgi:hypothetical protein